jgi:hypothetical protein
LVSEQVPSGNSLTTGRRSWIILRMEYQCLMVRMVLSMRFGAEGLKYFYRHRDIIFWLSVVTGYDSSKREKTATKKELKKNNKIAMDFIWEGLPKPVREKVGKCSSAKELWDKLHDIYSSPIADSENAKEDADTEQEERFSSC